MILSLVKTQRQKEIRLMGEGIGTRVRNLRKRRGVTLTQLGHETGLSPAFISNLERNLCSPTLDNIQRICAALDIELVKLLDDKNWGQNIIRAKDRKIVFEQKGQIRYESINFGPERLDGLLIVVEPHCEYKKEWTHAYDEIGFVLEGELTISLDEQQFVLHEGDAFYVDSKKKHSLSNLSEVPCSSLWIKQINNCH